MGKINKLENRWGELLKYLCVTKARRGQGGRIDGQRPWSSPQIFWYIHHQQSTSWFKVVIGLAAEMFHMRSLYLVRTNKEMFLYFFTPLLPLPPSTPLVLISLSCHCHPWPSQENVSALITGCKPPRTGTVFWERKLLPHTESNLNLNVPSEKNKPRTSLFHLIVIWLAFKSHTLCIWNSRNASISWAFQHFNQSIFQNKKTEMSNSNHLLISFISLCYTKLKALPVHNLP